MPTTGDGGLPVLMYHSVSAAQDGPLRSLAVPPERLREQLAALGDAGYALLGLTDALARVGTDPATPVVAVTFDDGYRNLLTHGVDVLRDLGAGATLYMSAGHAGKPAGWMAGGDRFGPLLTWSELRDVAAAGVEIGNHSLVHHPLDVLPAPVLEREVRDSADLLRQRTQLPVRSFAYPHGYNDARVRAAVARHGHVTACEVGRRICRPGRDRALSMPRLQPTPDHSGADLLRLVRTGGGRLEPALKRAAQPGWRVVRRVGRRLGRNLT
ncbi:polysaccharide deacetylase family protein [Phytohabitans sp. ZYX-F-186]|uniref:Polysaccharide deacetylase family protein n=1 Tax=Phytohabitans maris TaxID=3071409 RepID=A0ABU0ZMH2_9ACTN|nr:polysaccharide deacetylase family protein [Phytohabitans sp. ZYX-F-186]MDQ7908235.1 polysaccharide deacetylase family protein [Phytohabitans sp. ZYX-F-186]